MANAADEDEDWTEASADAEELVVLPATLGSNWLFENRVMEIGSSYCTEAMNSVDYGVDELGSKGVAAIHFEGDYGDDAAVGAKIAAEARGVKFTDITIAPGGEPGPARLTGRHGGAARHRPEQAEHGRRGHGRQDEPDRRHGPYRQRAGPARPSPRHVEPAA